MGARFPTSNSADVLVFAVVNVVSVAPREPLILVPYLTLFYRQLIGALDCARHEKAYVGIH